MVSSNPIADGNEPLSPEERETVLDVVDEFQPVTRYAILGAMYTGLEAPALAHIQPRMVRETDSGIRIVIPSGEVECQSAAGKAGGRSQWRVSGEKTEKCGYCTGSDGFEFQASRVIPVRDERAVSEIEEFFSLYNVTPSINTIHRRVKSVSDDCDVDRLSPKVLRHTFPVILAEKGFTQSEIGGLMGWGEATVQAINFRQRVGRYCAGENPFLCGVETADGSSCQQPSLGKDEVCDYHREDRAICGAVMDDGGGCEKSVSNPDDHCFYHQDNPRCGAETSKGEPCQRQVDHPDDHCAFH